MSPNNCIQKHTLQIQHHKATFLSKPSRPKGDAATVPLLRPSLCVCKSVHNTHTCNLKIWLHVTTALPSLQLCFVRATQSAKPPFSALSHQVAFLVFLLPECSCDQYLYDNTGSIDYVRCESCSSSQICEVFFNILWDNVHCSHLCYFWLNKAAVFVLFVCVRKKLKLTVLQFV